MERRRSLANEARGGLLIASQDRASSLIADNAAMNRSSARKPPRRYTMYAMIAGNQMCNYAVRLALPSLIQVASKELQLSDGARAMLLSAHTPGYLLTQIPSGILTQRLGAKRLLTLNTGGAAVLLLLVPSAAASGGARGVQMNCHPCFLHTSSNLSLQH